jgi:cytochrome c peroxidase
MNTNFIKFVKASKLTILVGLFAFIIISCKKEIKQIDFRENLEHSFKVYMDSCIVAINTIQNSNDVKQQQKSWLIARKYFKKSEPLLLFFDRNNYNSVNAANIYRFSEEDIPDMRDITPMGFQVTEELLFGEEVIDTVLLKRNVAYMHVKIAYSKENNHIKNAPKRNYLEMMRAYVVNTATKGITGFDSPILGNSLLETASGYQGLLEYLSDMKSLFTDINLYNELEKEFLATVDLLKNTSFENFDRYEFIKNNIRHQLVLINDIEKDWGIEMNKNLALNPNTTQIFSEDFFNSMSFTSRYFPNDDENVTALGKELFYDKKLSKNVDISCATCHKPELAFSDGLAKAIGENGKVLLRNSPTITYSQFQRSLFYDGRVVGLEAQITNVVTNKDEFHQDMDHIVAYINSNNSYKKRFNTYYKDSINEVNIRHAISNYSRSLAVFDSKFDNNINEKEVSLMVSEKKGFNLFMGKAACATCHFPPAFNGTVPPYYKETEFEVIGVPKTKKWENAELDSDLGRYHIFPMKERKGYFKTPSLRNIEKTAPYMHNSVYNNLEEVMKFYNKGGGIGIGIDIENQTLPFSSLDLSDKEIEDIIAFMKTLTDTETLY